MSVSNSLAIIGLMFVSAVASAGSVASLSVESEAWRVSVADRIESDRCLGGAAFEFVCESLVEGEIATTLEVCNETTDVTSVHLLESRVIIVGVLPHGGEIATIYDLATKQEVDRFFGYSLSVSPSARFAVFKKYFPRFAPTEYRDEIVLIYDLSLTREENRVVSARLRPNPENGGFALFPQTPLTSEKASSRLPIAEASILPGFVWEEEGADVAFLAQYEPGGTFVVGARLQPEAHKARVYVAKVCGEGRSRSDIVAFVGRGSVSIGCSTGNKSSAESVRLVDAGTSYETELPSQHDKSGPPSGNVSPVADENR